MLKKNIAVSWLVCQIFCAFRAFAVTSPINTAETTKIPISEVSCVYTFSEAAETINGADDETLFVFDVDEVIVTGVDGCLKPEADHIINPLLHKAMREATTPDQKKAVENLLSIVTAESERILVEPVITDIIQALQKRGIKVIGLTAAHSTGLGYIPSIPKWRIDQLRSFGIVFSTFSASSTWFSLTSIARPDLPAPVFAEGILFSKYYAKGEVLAAFLQEIDWKPKKIVFFDDLRENVLSVKMHSERLAVPFQGFQYLGAKLLPYKLDPKVIHYQWDYLLREGIYLSDRKASAMCDQN